MPVVVDQEVVSKKEALAEDIVPALAENIVPALPENIV